MVYFIKAENRIKIGYANDPKKRISQIQTSCPYQLEVLLIINGSYDDERHLHNKFKEYRTTGEWFSFEESIKEFIEQSIINDRRYEYGFVSGEFGDNEQILRIRKDNKITLEQLGESLSISKQSARKRQNGEKNGSISIKKLREAGESMGYKLEYRFVKLK